MITLLVGSLAAQELSTIVFPSEDELREAFRNGDINYEQYLQLREIIIHGVDANSLYLLDEIPNLFYFRKPDSTLADPLEREQQSGFRATPADERSGSRYVQGRIGYQFYQGLEEDEPTWYRSFGDLSVADRYRVRFRVNREKSGRERVVSRSIGYTDKTGRLHRLTLGSFTTRFGLGTTFGYHGKRLAFSDNLDTESFLYPDYGGYNGLLVSAQSERLAADGLFSLTRDTVHRMMSVGLMVRRTGARFCPGLMVGLNRVVDRTTEQALNIPLAGLYAEHKYSAGYMAVEVSRQAGGQVSGGAAVVEGRHRFEAADLRYTAWSYSHGFVDLTSGSKAGYITHTDTLASIALDYSNRRSGQSGLLVKSVVELSDRFDFSNAVLFANRSGDQTRQQLSSSFIRRIDRNLMMQLTYLGRFRSYADAAGDRDTDHRVRLEGRFSGARLAVRCYIGYDAKTDDRGHACLFGGVRYRTESNNRLQLWSNFGDINSKGLNYWYLFVQGDWPVISGLRGAAKLANTYRRDSSEPNNTQLTLQLTAVL